MGRGATDTKSRILEAAANLFSIHGYAATTMEDILTASGITKGAFYYYFKSKEALCLAVLEEAAGQYERFIESITETVEPKDRLKTFLEELAVRNASGRWIWCRLMVRLIGESESEGAKVVNRVQVFWQWFLDTSQVMMEQRRHSGKIQTESDTRIQTRMLLWLWMGLITAGNLPHAKVDPDVIPDLLMQAIQI
ncbi:MAG: TetR/AcrR family transcriptional regulator [Sedimentisphaerales bacterium]|nr:TetR/AcrR family transcriptional regulator [Sedimentisphaerales bacterium]